MAGSPPTHHDHPTHPVKNAITHAPTITRPHPENITKTGENGRVTRLAV